jgi:hypothetical protein
MSTSLSADGRYLIVVPKLSAMRVLDLRTGTVLARFTSNSTSTSHGSTISRSVLLSSSSSSSSSNSMGQQRSRSDSYQRLLRKDSALNTARAQRLSTASTRTSLSSQGQYVSFCAGDAMVVTGGAGGGGGGVDEGCAVKLWSADSGHLIKSLSLRCGFQSSSSPSLSFSNSFSQSLSLSQSGAQLHQKSSAVRDSSPGIAFSRENDRDRDRDREVLVDTMSTSAEEKRTDMRERVRPRRGSDEVEREVRESNWLNDNEMIGDRDRERDTEGECDRDRNRDRGSGSGGDRDNSDSERERDRDTDRDREGGQRRGRDREIEREGERDRERDRDVCRDPQLEVIASSPVFSTRYDERYGIIAAASAAGISLWI